MPRDEIFVLRCVIPVVLLALLGHPLCSLPLECKGRCRLGWNPHPNPTSQDTHGWCPRGHCPPQRTSKSPGPPLIHLPRCGQREGEGGRGWPCEKKGERGAEKSPLRSPSFFRPIALCIELCTRSFFYEARVCLSHQPGTEVLCSLCLRVLHKCWCPPRERMG